MAPVVAVGATKGRDRECISLAMESFRADEIVLRLMHKWFGFWEHRVTLPYRIVAVTSGSLGTAVAMGLASRTRWWRHLPLSVACWALLGKMEGDDRDRRL